MRLCGKRRFLLQEYYRSGFSICDFRFLQEVQTGLIILKYYLKAKKMGAFSVEKKASHVTSCINPHYPVS